MAYSPLAATGISQVSQLDQVVQLQLRIETINNRQVTHRDGLVGSLILHKPIEQRLDLRKVGAVFSVLQELLFPLDETVRDGQSV